MKQAHLKEAVGTFRDLEKLNEAVAALEGSKFSRYDITVLSNKSGSTPAKGEDAPVKEWGDEQTNAPHGVSVRPEEKTIGAAMMVGIPTYIGGCIGALIVNPASNLVLIGAAAFGSLLGALIGGNIAFILSKKSKKKMDRALRKGGLSVWVRIQNTDREKLALDILRKYDGENVHVSESS